MEKQTNPILTLSNLYGDDIIYTSRPSYSSNPWLALEEHQCNFSTGRELIIAGQTPVIVHAASVTDKLTSLFNAVRIEKPKNILKFEDQATYEQLIKKSAYEYGKKIYFQYVHESDVLENEHYALDKNTFIALNNKSRLPEWTGYKYLPEREVVKIDDFEEAVSNWEFPFVLKPGDDLPTAGGYGVMICHNNKDLIKAKQAISKASHMTNTLIIEQKIEIATNYSVQYAYSKEEGIRYLGTTEQLTDQYGYYKGNHNAQDVPNAVIQAGREIMEIGAKNGYFGIAGFDLLVDMNNDIYAIDLNFRQNGSTSMLVLDPFLRDGYHKFYNYISPHDNEHFFKSILKYVQKGLLFPIAYYDGDWFSNEIVKSRFCGIWHGSNKEGVERIEQQFLKEIQV
ncbi:L-aspartate--L-methionine ligase LdmS [Staphylococcus pseudoxylosus]|uniref:L-aspartate--L-methionine ligase LdmS n=1 Tax=Staphylococcus pseudoxylosus TaxID=2282419 RepID=UPI00193981A1|nr:ATP-grasp domain-containing protein [Staphylococcus pseudoxylosus]MBM2659767.1 ATP-grasp domain-containing protein [Staphylococcus pseudoxylosus]